jgi:hypothetical protein
LKWAEVVEDSFAMTLPITPYRSFSPNDITDGQRHVHGVRALIVDTASHYIMMQSVPNRFMDEKSAVHVQYYSGPYESIIQDDVYMCKWHMCTTNAMHYGARCEVSKTGMIKAVFSQSNKLQSVEMVFDAMR